VLISLYAFLMRGINFLTQGDNFKNFDWIY